MNYTGDVKYSIFPLNLLHIPYCNILFSTITVKYDKWAKGPKSGSRVSNKADCKKGRELLPNPLLLYSLISFLFIEREDKQIHLPPFMYASYMNGRHKYHCLHDHYRTRGYGTLAPPSTRKFAASQSVGENKSHLPQHTIQ